MSMKVVTCAIILSGKAQPGLCSRDPIQSTLKASESMTLNLYRSLAQVTEVVKHQSSDGDGLLSTVVPSRQISREGVRRK